MEKSKERGIIIIGADAGQGKCQTALTMIGALEDKLLIHNIENVPTQEQLKKIAHAMGISMSEVGKAFARMAEVFEEKAKPSLDEIVMEIKSVDYEELNPVLYDERNDTSPKSFGMRKMGARKFR